MKAYKILDAIYGIFYKIIAKDAIEACDKAREDGITVSGIWEIGPFKDMDLSKEAA